MTIRRRKSVLRTIASAFFILLIPCLTIVFRGLHDNLHAADLAVVLGNKVQPDGQPSKMLQARLDHAVELYRQGYFKLILVSGGHGKEGYDEPVVMRSYLESHGIPHDAIIEDNNGKTTWMTARSTLQILTDNHLESVLVISQYFHMPRCQLAFAKFNIGPIYTSHAPYWSIRDCYSVPREVVGYVDYSLRKPGTTRNADASE